MNPTLSSVSFLGLFLSSFIVIASFSLSSAQSSFMYTSCGGTQNYTDGSTFAANLETFLSTITSNGQNNYYNLTVGTKPGDDLVSGSAFCRADLPSSDCHSGCTDAARQIRHVCPTQKEVIGWYRSCIIRYSNYPIAGIMESAPLVSVPNLVNSSDPKAFDRELKALLRSLQDKAAAEDRVKWAAGSRNVSGSQSVYAVLQCTPDLSGSNCSKCLEAVIDDITTCCHGKIGSAILAPSCGLRFDVNRFYSSIAASSPLSPPVIEGNSRQNRKSLLKLCVSIATPTFMVAIFLAIGVWICQRRRKTVQTSNNRRFSFHHTTQIHGDIEETIIVESLQYDLNTIKAATHDFSLDNKLGEGGFGEVYKGKLESGQEIAVKRLSKTSDQGIVEFKTEVILVAKLQHKNLVKLLGFCLESEEKILVYELLCNLSLDRFLFEPTKNISLDWETRFKIILGVARGLLYLHEDSRLKIVHRDLKSSNILLDESMNPKISDFGLAKLFDMEQTQGDTNRIVGTYGYMAPEYALTGHFSVKSDVFSFGVIILEIVSGQKNRRCTHPQDEEALLHRAWRLWNEKKVLDLVDPKLENNYQVEEMTKCIRIGLLSIQENPARRPRMTSIVAAFNGDSISLPEPTAPHFLDNVETFEDEIEAFNSYTVLENITDLSPR